MLDLQTLAIAGLLTVASLLVLGLIALLVAPFSDKDSEDE
jgi:hypothetical protein